MSYAQQYGRIAISTPLGEDALFVRGFSGDEGLSRLFRFRLELLSEDEAIAMDRLVGQQATVRMLLADGCFRYWNGLIGNFWQGGRQQGLTSYTAELVPALWLLKRTSDCRIFQNRKTPAIVEQILGEAGIRDFALRLYGDFPEREYCVQYRETDFDFLSRLMEEDGIYYFFEHEKDKHTLVLANAPEAHRSCPGQPRARYEAAPGGHHDEDAVLEWELGQELRPGSYALQDYNFESPGTDLLSNIAGRNAWELFEYPGAYRRRSEGEARVRLRLQETEASRVAVRGASDCRAFASGFHFELTDHYRSDHNQLYLFTGVQHSAQQGAEFRSGTEQTGFEYRNRFECLPRTTPFRPARVTPRPVVHGAQTAVVVGKAGEEIWTDKYGRVKVQFHWDRYGKKDENSSCWVRVSQPWAGKGWGAISLPRIGQEVVVSFLEGDPDQPLITGRVYNAEQMPPYELPAEQTKTTLKTDSSKGGGGFNELRFEDAKGREQVLIHAERDHEVRVKKDFLRTVGGQAHMIAAADQFEQIGGDLHFRVKGDQNQKVDGAVSLAAGMDVQQKAGTNYALEAGTEIHLKSGLNLVVESGTTLTLKVGGSFVNLNPAGVYISGPMVMINSGGAAGSGVGASPHEVKPPREAEKPKPGGAARPKPGSYSPAAMTLKQAAQIGVPFCDI